MSTQTLEGKDVVVASARGDISRTVVADLGEVIVVGSREDYEHAKTHGIDRFSVAFRRSDVVRLEGVDK